MVDRTIAFLRERKGTPCFVNLWLDDTHTPFHPSREQLAAAGIASEKPTEEQRFRAVLGEMDKQIGRFMDGLRELGLEQNTLVLFLGDNCARARPPRSAPTRPGGSVRRAQGCRPRTRSAPRALRSTRRREERAAPRPRAPRAPSRQAACAAQTA
jgi:arylsulfatase A-like enzyme